MIRMNITISDNLAQELESLSFAKRHQQKRDLPQGADFVCRGTGRKT
jgi:hypothetical protein